MLTGKSGARAAAVMMPSPATESAPPVPAARVLESLRSAHDALVAAMADLGGVLTSDWPEPPRYTAARWRLSNLSRKRRTLVNAVTMELRSHFPGSKALEDLAQSERAMLDASTRHVGAWPPERVAAEWAAYREASTSIRTRMQAHVDAEQSVLYPMLEQLAFARRSLSNLPPFDG